MDARIEPQRANRSQVLPIAVVGLLVVVASGAVIFFVIAGSAASEFAPIEVAELAPDDTHFFMALNTDFASAPWTAMPELLRTLAVEQQVRDDLSESAAEEGLDFEGEIVPAIGSVRRAGFAAQYTSDGGEWLFFLDTSDPDEIVRLLAGTSLTLESEERDEDLGLDFKLYEDSDPSGSPMVVTTHEGILYLSEFEEHTSNFIRRQQSTAPLSDSARFRAAIDEVADDALLIGYGNGNVLDHRDFRDVIDALGESAEVDPRDGTVAFSVTVRSSGFGSRAVARLESGFGQFGESVADPTDLDSIAPLTPDDAIFTFAGSGLHDFLVAAIEEVRTEPEFADSIEPFEDATGLSLEDDLIPLLGSSYAIAAGGDGFTAEEMDVDDIWAIGLIESTDAVRLAECLRVVLRQIEIESCDCDSGVTIEDEAGYVAIKWPEITLSDATLDGDPSYITTLELLRSDPTALMFVNVSALPADVLREASADFASDPDGYDTDFTAILGFGAATYSDEVSIAFDFVLPIDTDR